MLVFFNMHIERCSWNLFLCVTVIKKNGHPDIISDLFIHSFFCLFILFLSSLPACNDLVASGSDRKPNALVQVSVIDPRKQHVICHGCTEIVEVRNMYSHAHTLTPPLWVTGFWVMLCPSLPTLFFFFILNSSSPPLTLWSGKDSKR